MHVYDAVVIGAGLSASYHLRRPGIDHVSSTQRRRPFSPLLEAARTSPCAVRTYNAPKVRFSATVGEELEVEVALG